MRRRTPVVAVVPTCVALLLVVGTGCQGSGSDVFGRVEVVFVSETEQAAVPVDLSETNLAILSLDRDGLFREHVGVGTEDGTFLVKDVPEGPYYLYRDLGIPFFRVLDDRDVLLQSFRLGRPDVARSADAETRLELHLDGMDPWGPEDRLELYCAGCGGLIDLLEGTLPDEQPIEGAEQASLDVQYDRFATPRPLVESAKGDRGILAQVRREPRNSYRQEAIVRWAELSELNQSLGELRVVEAEFEGTDPETLEGVFPRSGYADLSVEVGPAGTAVLATWFVVGAVPQSEVLGGSFLFPVVSLLFDSADRDVSFAADLASPFPGPWHWVIYEAQYQAKVSDGFTVPASVSSRVPLDQFDPSLGIVPIVLPVRNLRIDGRLAFRPIEGAGESFEIAWEAPRGGSVDFYSVGVYEAPPSLRGVVFFSTEDTSVVVPPGIVELGTEHVAVVIAAKLTADRQPGGSASAVSAIFVP